MHAGIPYPVHVHTTCSNKRENCAFAVVRAAPHRFGDGGKTHNVLQEACVRCAVPYQLVRDVSLFERWEVLAVSAYLRCATGEIR